MDLIRRQQAEMQLEGSILTPLPNVEEIEEVSTSTPPPLAEWKWEGLTLTPPPLAERV